MPLQFYISIGSVILSVVLGISLANHNLKVLRATKQQRIEARRAYKKRKNARLRQFLKIEDINNKK